MMEERKTEEFEDDLKKWKICFDLEVDRLRGKGYSNVFVSFVINRKEYPLTTSDIEELRQELKDLGKFKIVRQGKEFLEK